GRRRRRAPGGWRAHSRASLYASPEGRCKAPRAATVRALRLIVDVTAPVAFLDLLDFLFGQAEVVADFVDERLADGHDRIVVVLARILDRALEKGDLVGQGVAVRPLSFGERDALVEAEQRVRRLDVDRRQLCVGRLVFDDDR